MYVPLLDGIPQKKQLNAAIKRIGKGVSLDGIPATILHLIPQCFLDNILILLQKVFIGDYGKSCF